ncbi:MAG: hypothetical protein LKM36_10125 [Flavobacteriales bacterium]|jgi:hypothetical protein|nr:hypothetical protein [Flavobacteriales bacterium]
MIAKPNPWRSSKNRVVVRQDETPGTMPGSIPASPKRFMARFFSRSPIKYASTSTSPANEAQSMFGFAKLNCGNAVGA